VNRESRSKLATIVGRFLGEALLVPPTLIWSVNQLGGAIPWTWRTWLALAVLASLFRQRARAAA
jgi:hypothetical protein